MQKKDRRFFQIHKNGERTKPRIGLALTSLKNLNWRCTFRGQDWIAFLTFDDCSLLCTFFVCTLKLHIHPIMNWNFNFSIFIYFKFLIALIYCAPVSMFTTQKNSVNRRTNNSSNFCALKFIIRTMISAYDFLSLLT